MLYLGTPSRADGPIEAALDAGEIGALLQPWGSTRPPEVALRWTWAADNGCFVAEKFDPEKWLEWLAQMAPAIPTCLFATVPDVVGDAAATLARWPLYAPTVAALGYRPAFVGQDGLTIDEVPWSELGAVFLGGSTEWKESEAAFALAAEAHRRGVWVHMGRVNTLRRMRLARSWTVDGEPVVDSVDGTFLTFGPDANLIRLRRMMAVAAATPALFPVFR